MRHVLLALVTLPLLSCTSAHGAAPPDIFNVLYSLSLDQKGVLELSVYNPTDYAACTSFLNWLGPNDNLRVIGRDGKEWEYIGLAADPVGRPQDVKIAPHSEVTNTYDVRKNYKPVSSETRIGKIYYGALFHRC